MTDAFDKLRMMEDEMNKYILFKMLTIQHTFVFNINHIYFRFEEEIGIPNYVDGTPGTPTFGQINRHMGPSGGYSAEHDSTNAYMESAGEYDFKQRFLI